MKLKNELDHDENHFKIVIVFFLYFDTDNIKFYINIFAFFAFFRYLFQYTCNDLNDIIFPFS